MGKQILITGVTGFIGRVLLRYLLKDSTVEHIHGIDNLCNSSLDPEDPLFSNSKVTTQICTVEEYVPEQSFDEIYHLASPVGPVGVLKWSGTMGPMIVRDTHKLACLAIKTGAKLMDISTSEVYGQDPGGIPQLEELNKVVPSYTTVRLEYGVSKLLCEISLANLAKVSNLECRIVRPYNIISAGQSSSAGFVLPRFLNQALRNEPITVYQPGTQRRTFTHVEDFVEGMFSVMEKGKNATPYNIGNPANLYSILDLAKMIIDASGSKSKIEIIDPKNIHGSLFEEAWEKIPNIEKIKKDTGWSPKRDMSLIVKEAVERELNV